MALLADWDSLYSRWRVARDERRATEFVAVSAEAVRASQEPSREDLTWFANALSDRWMRWFVATLYAKRPVPKRLFEPMIRAAVTDCDASDCRRFIGPCVETFGCEAVVDELGKHALDEDYKVRKGVQKCLYWVVPADEFRRRSR